MQLLIIDYYIVITGRILRERIILYVDLLWTRDETMKDSSETLMAHIHHTFTNKTTDKKSSDFQLDVMKYFYGTRHYFKIFFLYL